jgi:cell division protein FtsB
MSPPPPSSAARPRPARAPARTPTGRRPAGRRAHRTAAPRVPRRVSGPARAPAPGRPRPRSRPTGVAAAVVRTARFASTLPDRRLVDRLVRGRAWIALIAFLLMGIVAMQVSLLKLNAGIGRDVERSDSLERRNGELRTQVSRLESGERIQDRAGALGMVMPPAGAVSYVRARVGADAAAAAAALRAGRLAPAAASAPAPSAPDQPAPAATEP